MRRIFGLLIVAVVGTLLTGCTADPGTESQTPIGIVAAAEYNPENLGGAVSWTITGGAGRIPDDASVLISISRSDAHVASPSTESSDRTTTFLTRIGEIAKETQVVVIPGTGSDEIIFFLQDNSEKKSAEVPRVHVAVVDNASGNIVGVRSIPVSILHL